MTNLVESIVNEVIYKQDKPLRQDTFSKGMSEIQALNEMKRPNYQRMYQKKRWKMKDFTQDTKSDVHKPVTMYSNDYRHQTMTAGRKETEYGSRNGIY